MNSYKEFTILCVDDDVVVMSMYKSLFEMMFKEVYIAENGEEGLELYKTKKPDIVLTDQQMPKMTGLEMIENIRKIDKTIPIILVTAFDDKELLENAINQNVTSFVKKPIKKENLFNSFELVSKYVIGDRILMQNQKKELEYKTYHEKVAYKKENKIIKVQKPKDIFDIEVFYEPLDITCGDSYSIRDNYLFLVDAMGKGVSASITAMISTAVFNYLVDEKYEFSKLISEFKKFMDSNLLDDEVLSCSFYYFDDEYFYYSCFSMPAVLIQKGDELTKLRSNNPSLAPYLDEIKIDKIPLNEIDKMLCYSDGVNEAEVEEGLYGYRYLKNDFKTSNSLDEFEKIRNQKDIEISDDTTYFFIKAKK